MEFVKEIDKVIDELSDFEVQKQAVACRNHFLKKIQETKELALYESLIMSLLPKKTLEILQMNKDNKSILLDVLNLRTGRLFSGKQIVKMQNQPRWIIYAVEAIGKKTHWWSVTWTNKQNINKIYKEPACLCCYGRLRDCSIYHKEGDALVKINMKLRLYLKNHGITTKYALIEMFVKRQLQALFRMSYLKMTLVISKDILKLIIQFCSPIA